MDFRGRGNDNDGSRKGNDTDELMVIFDKMALSLLCLSYFGYYSDTNAVDRLTTVDTPS
jgi:hypothetical protein